MMPGRLRYRNWKSADCCEPSGLAEVPVRFQLKDAGGHVVQAASLPIWAVPTQLGPTSASIDENTYNDPATAGDTFRWDGTEYIYNWSTKGLKAGYYYRITVILDDGTSQSVYIGLR